MSNNLPAVLSQLADRLTEGEAIYAADREAMIAAGEVGALPVFDEASRGIAAKVASEWLDGVSSAGTRRAYRAALDALGAVMWGREPARSGAASREHRNRRAAAGLTDVDLSPWCVVAWHRLTPAFAANIRRAVVDRVEAGSTSRATANKWLSALRGFLTHAESAGVVEPLTYSRVMRARGPFASIPNRGDAGPTGRMVDTGERRAIMDSTREDRSAGRAVGHRDAAAIAMLECGLRRSEVAGLELADVTREASGFTLTVRGKGGRVRRVPMGNGHASALAAWLDVRGPEPGPVLLRCAPVTGEITTTRRGISGESVAAILRRHSADNGPACHDYRRTFVSTLLDAGADVATVGRLVGHASPDTTVRYDRRGDDELREAGARMPSSYRD